MITRGIRNNNPFNIKISNSNWKGKIKVAFNTDGVFEQFESMKYGLRAGVVLLRNYQKKHNIYSIKDFISRFAPSNENDVKVYVIFVCNYLRSYGYFVHPVSRIKIDSIEFFIMCCAICEYESKFDVSYYDMISAYGKFK